MQFRAHEEVSASQIVSALLRALMTGYQLWGVRSRLPLADLPAFLRTTDARLYAIVGYLATEGLISLDGETGTVRLTENGARDLRCTAPVE